MVWPRGNKMASNYTTKSDRLSSIYKLSERRLSGFISLSDGAIPPPDNYKVITMAQLKPIADDQTFSSKTVYEGSKKVRVVFGIRRDAKSPRFEKEALLDYGKVSESELYVLASYGAKVRLQSILRNLSVEAMLNPETLSVIDVKHDLLESSQTPTDPTTSAIRSIQKALGVSEEVAKSTLDEAKKKVEKAKGAGPIKTLLKSA